MAQTLEDLYYNFLDAARVNGAKDIGIEVINRYLAMANYDLFNEIWGREKDVQGSETSQNVSDSLRKFKSNSSIVIAAGSGNLPADFFHATGVIGVKDGSSVEMDIVTDLEYEKRMTNSITQPTATYPVARILSTTITVYPTTAVDTVTLYYYKKPTQPVIGLTADATTGVDIYYSAGSTAPDWTEDHYKDLLRYMLSYLKLGIGDIQSAEYLDQKEKTEV
jgi:hypothetical protein